MRLDKLLILLGIFGCSEAPESSEATSPATLLIADRDGDRVLIDDGEGRTVLVHEDTCELTRPASVVVGPDRDLFVATFSPSSVLAFDSQADFVGVFYADVAYLEEPVALAFQHDHLYVLGNDTRSMVVLDRAGGFVTEFGYPAMRDGHDFEFGPDGSLYVCTSPTSRADGLVQIWRDHALVGSFAPPDEVELATSIAFDADGNALVSDFRYGTITSYNPATGERLAVMDQRFERPLNIEFSPNGALHVLDAQGVWRITNDGERQLRVPSSELVGARSIAFK